MILRVALPGLFIILIIPSCQSLKVGANDPTKGANPYELADNAGYSEGGFYGDPAHATTPGTYPAEGQTFGGYDSSAYAPSYSRAATWDQARVAPFSESGYGYSSSTGSAHASAARPARPSSPPVRKPAARAARNPPATHAVASTPRKRPPGLASTGRSQGSRTTAGTMGGSVMKAVYQASGSSRAAPRKKATLHRVHTVQRGDTLSALAARYDVSVATMKKQNHLTSDLILVGQEISID